MMTVSDIYTTAPAGPLSPEQRQVFDTLAALGIPYERVEHDWANTMEDCKAVSAALGVDVCKNLVLCNRQKTQFYLLCMPSSKPFHTKDLSHQLGCARLSFAPPEAMEELLRVHPGSASVLSLLFDRDRRVQLVMQPSLYRRVRDASSMAGLSLNAYCHRALEEAVKNSGF